MPFAFHFLHDKRGEKVLYIVMLPHLSDISKIEVQAKDQYKLKVNTKKGSEEEEIHYHVWKSISSCFSQPQCFVCPRENEDSIGKLKIGELSLISFQSNYI